MPPYRGQGANHATEDVNNIVEVIDRIASARAKEQRGGLQVKLILEYSDEVVKRGAEETCQSIQNGQMLMEYYDAKESPYFKKGLEKG